MYSFRVPLILGGTRPDTTEPTLTLLENDGERVWLDASGPLDAATRATFHGSGYATEAQAEQRGIALTSALRLTALHSGITLDFFDRRSPGGLTDTALDEINASTSEGLQAIRDRAGVRVHRTDEELVAFTLSGDLVAHTPTASVVSQFTDALKQAIPSPRAHLAFDLFCQSHHAHSADARLLALVSAVEALVQPQPIPEDERDLLHTIARDVEASPTLADEERRHALANRIRSLTDESVRSGVQRVLSRLEPRRYDGKRPMKFFGGVYELRSRLAHGDDTSWHEVSSVSAELWTLARDLIELEFIAPSSDEPG